MKYYKILVNGKSCHGGDMKWSLPVKQGRKWIPGKWHAVKGKLDMCQNGIHITTKPFEWYKWGCACYEAEWQGEKIDDDKKAVVRKCRLLKEVKHPQWWLDAIEFVNGLKDIKWMQNGELPKNKKIKMFDTWNAAWNAAQNASWNASWNVSWNAARDAAQNAARGEAQCAARGAARGTSWNASWDAAQNAARGEARDAAQNTAWNAAWNAALFCSLIICENKIAKKHRDYVKLCWSVWEAGYGVLCDIDGMLYCYKKI